MIQPKDETVVNYRKGDKQIWPSWKDKTYGERSKKEKDECNLMLLPKPCIDLDPDDEEAEKLINEGIKNGEITQYIKLGVEGRRPHYIVEYKDLDKYDGEVLKEIKRKVIQKYKCDEQMLVNATIIPNKPHHKSGQIVKVIGEVKGINEIPEEILQEVKKKVEKDIELSKSKPIQSNEEFKDYFETDPFWKLLNKIDWENQPKKNMGFNWTVMKNLGIAGFKSGLSEEAYKVKIKPFLKKVKGYDETAAIGWYKKARDGFKSDEEEIEYNKDEINKWYRQWINLDKDIYDVYESISFEEDKKDFNPEDIIITDKQLSLMAQEKQTFLIEKTWAKDGVVVLVSPPNVGKSLMALYWAICIATGKKVFDRYSTIKSRVLIADEENGKPITKERSEWFRKGLEIKEGLDNLGYVIFQQLMFENGGMKKVMKIIENFKPEVLIIDTMRNVTDIDENDSKQAVGFMKGLKFLQQKYNLSILLIHHTRKSDPRYKGTGSIDDAMGSRAITGKADGTLKLLDGGKNKLILYREKIRGIKKPDPETLIIDSDENARGETTSIKFRIAINSEVELEKKVMCANKIMEWIQEKNITEFVTKDIEEIGNSFNFDNNDVSEARKLLMSDGKIKLKEGYKKGKFVVVTDSQELLFEDVSNVNGGNEEK